MPSEDIDNKSFDKEAFINWVESFNWTPEETKGWETFKLMLREYKGNNDDK